ncbi:hypothetical protein [Shimia sediminis]|uniref:hypothetical protein n=1 Tax=Shimia sediminis TaxID=2497945 RepID=UPI001F3567DC|nr:hypothetical protein [Shimia sediminis]
MRRIALIFMLLANAGHAEDWQTLTTKEITTALSGRTIDYDAAWQEFLPSGRTLYNSGRDSWGYWEARDNQYCSQWPPADGWACYNVLQRGTQIRFVGESGDATDGTLRE